MMVIGPRSWIASARQGRRSTACSASSFGMLDAISEFTRYLPPRVWRARATLRKALDAHSDETVVHHRLVRLRIVGVVAGAAAAAAVGVVALASTSAAGLPSYTEGYRAWPRINEKPFTRCGPPCAHSGVKNVYASKRKVGARYPNGTVIVKTVAQSGDRPHVRTRSR